LKRTKHRILLLTKAGQLLFLDEKGNTQTTLPLEVLSTVGFDTPNKFHISDEKKIRHINTLEGNNAQAWVDTIKKLSEA
jgi:hypothetical protein